MFNLFRVVACLAVVAQHSFIWADMSSNFVGSGFITMLHLSRTCFFFLTGLVVCYAQISHPRSLGAFWKRRYWEIGIPYVVWTGIYLVFTLVTVRASWDEVGSFLRHNVPLGYSQMYFVAVVFQFYLLFPLLLKLLRRDPPPQLCHGSKSCAGTLFQPSRALPRATRPSERGHPRRQFLLADKPGLPHLSGVLHRRRACGTPPGAGAALCRSLVPADPDRDRRGRRPPGGVVHGLGVVGKLDRPGFGYLPTLGGGVVSRGHRRPLHPQLVVGSAGAARPDRGADTLCRRPPLWPD